ncbi:MAG: GNAT family N-acetyltransferase [Chloroflexota bacterium]
MQTNVITISNTALVHASMLAAIQKFAFPNLDPEQHLTAAQYRRHIEVFPEGQFVALNGQQAVGSTTTLRLNFNINHPQHTMAEITDNGWLGNHDPHGEWLYGADLMVHPEFRKRGIARQLYTARYDLVRRLGLRGQVSAGMIPGYHKFAHCYTIGEYLRRVAAGDIIDPTLTAQLRVGFHYVAPIYNYLQDTSSGNAVALIVWENPDFGR